MPTISLTTYPGVAYVMVEIDWTDQPTVTYATVTRRNTVTGETVQLRPYIAYDGSGNILLSCGTAIFWDTEPPLNVELEYCTTAADIPLAINSNTDFETGVAPWVGILSAAVQSNLFAHTGTFSAQVTPNGTSDVPQLRDSTSYPVPAGTILAQAWVYTPPGWNGVDLSFTLQDTSTLLNTTYRSPVYAIPAGAWQLIRYTANTNGGNIVQTNVSFHGRPPNTTLFYVDDVSLSMPAAVGLTACDTTTVSSDSVWLKNPLSPCLDLEIGLCSPAMDFDCEEDSRISYAGMAADERAANTVLSEPTNRKYPVPVSRTRRGPTSTLLLIAHDCDARDAVVAANEPGTPLLFQAPEDYCIPDRYISVDALGEQRVSIDQREDFRLMTLPYATVDRPEGPANGICGSRIDDLCDLYTSWTAITLAGLDYADLIEGFASNDGPVNPLPPDARTWGDVDVEFADWAAVDAGGTRDWGELEVGL